MPINFLYGTWKRRFMELRPGQQITHNLSIVWLIVDIYPIWRYDGVSSYF